MHQFLNSIEFPSVNPEVANNLDRPITLEEVAAAIRSMKSNKTPGLDGFGIEFNKKFSDKLSPLLLNVFNESVEQ
ncbi:hypothetical protein LDENG_00250320 [Lucifuga dentata]|nr:hypothetical protein LDENG_00250320 [Lucifuga dentata]